MRRCPPSISAQTFTVSWVLRCTESNILRLRCISVARSSLLKRPIGLSRDLQARSNSLGATLQITCALLDGRLIASWYLKPRRLTILSPLRNETVVDGLCTYQDGSVRARTRFTPEG